MRIRRLSAIFWAICIIAFIFILYVVTDLSFKLPNIKPVAVDIDDNQWTSFESKLRHLEKELYQHHAVVGEIKTAVDQIVEQSHKVNIQPKKPNVPKKDIKVREFKVVADEPPKMHVKLNETSCPINQASSKTDIQMLSLYERMTFEDKDGGVWKQGWEIGYKDDQWNQKNKLKVFIVPHSHNDPGWIKTFENYYKTQTKAIFTNMVEKLIEGVGRKFIWAEISYLSLWWNSDANDKEKSIFRSLLKSGQIEIVTGGWVMNDEANSHWISIIQQLTTGHQWLLDNFEYIPKNAWSIDPFGYSSAQPYLYKLAGFENSVIQRVHYRVKKELALNRQLEFKWRQLWDGIGKTDMFTHMMPFYSYDVPHSCGPDPKICCQFDFKRLPGNGVTCPWGIAPRKIIQKNVDERAFLILDQWRKKSQLYRSNVLMFPLGDDFRYDRANEWDNQFQNYDAIIEYINSKDSWNAEVQFGTLEDYFKAVHEEVKMSNFPVLSGDFFTYADRNQHYWSGYYTSRPFYKNMDRVLMAYVRAAEIITAQACSSQAVTYIMSLQLRDRVELARRALSLFQHHDGVTGTSRDEVREDYAKKMLEAIKYSQSAIQQAAYYLLKQPTILEQTQPDIYFEVDDLWRKHDEIPSRITIALDAMSPSRRIVFYNALAFKRQEVITVFVSTPHVEVFDPEGSPMMAQISPVVAGEKRLGFAANKFQLSFPVIIDPLAITIYTVSLRDSMSINKYTSYSRVRIYNADYWNVEDIPKMFAIDQPAERLTEDITIKSGDSARVVATVNGLIKAIISPDGNTVPVHMDFVQYDSQRGLDNNSGAYLFIPSGPAEVFKPEPFPEMVVTEGPYKATLYTSLLSPKAAEVILAITVHNNPSLPQGEVEISNTFLIDPQADDYELGIRFSTGIKNGDVFYTDLNGMQMTKRRYFDKLPLQANFYPLPAATYIEDERTRLTLLTSTPLGMAALQSGQIEVMQDRRLTRDDNRGMNQGVLDNVRTRHTFKLIVEPAIRCQRPPAEQVSGYLSLGAHVAQQMFVQPPVIMHYTASEGAVRPSYSRSAINSPDLVLAAYHGYVTTTDKDGKTMQGMGVTLQRVHLDSCYGYKSIASSYPVGDGQIRLSDMLEISPQRVFNSSLTFVKMGAPVADSVLTLCPMEIRSVFINQTLKHG